MKCDICGEGETHLVCTIEEGILNYADVVYINHPPVYEDIPIYYRECDTCGLVNTGEQECQVNRAIYVTLRRQHGLSDYTFNRKHRHEAT